MRKLSPRTVTAVRRSLGAFIDQFCIAPVDRLADRLIIFVFSTMALMRVNLEVAASTFVVQPPTTPSHLFTLST
jgi:hypothetical protein